MHADLLGLGNGGHRQGSYCEQAAEKAHKHLSEGGLIKAEPANYTAALRAAWLAAVFNIGVLYENSVLPFVQHSAAYVAIKPVGVGTVARSIKVLATSIPAMNTTAVPTSNAIF